MAGLGGPDLKRRRDSMTAIEMAMSEGGEGDAARDRTGGLAIQDVERELVAYARRHDFTHRALQSVRCHLRVFARFLVEEGVGDDVLRVTRETMKRFQAWLGETTAARTQKPYATRIRYGFLSTVKTTYAALMEAGLVADDVSKVLRLPRLPRRLPPLVSEDQMKEVFAGADVETVMGYRDRTILELIYATLIRAHEVAGLVLADILEERKAILVRAKGKKERVIPVAKVAWEFLVHQRDSVRPFLLPETQHVFVGKGGRGLSVGRVSSIVAKYLDLAGFEEPGGAHVLRYAGATHMIERGADIREVQALLGHRSIRTTMGYTIATAFLLKKAHERSHPRETSRAPAPPPPYRERP